MNAKLSSLLGALSLAALATTGCKSEQKASGAGETQQGAQGSCGGGGQSSCSTSKPAGGQSSCSTSKPAGGQQSCGK